MNLAYDNRRGFRGLINYGQLPTSDSGSQPFTQNVLAHEFGHYLGLNHTCRGLRGVQENSEDEYCRGRTYAEMNNRMSYGTVLDPTRHAQPWIARLVDHQYDPGGSPWRAALVT
jgi:hypothetical protein